MVWKRWMNGWMRKKWKDQDQKGEIKGKGEGMEKKWW